MFLFEMQKRQKLLQVWTIPSPTPGFDPFPAPKSLKYPPIEPMNTTSQEPRLTSLSHGGGCGCKIAPGLLSEILQSTTALPVPPELLVGIDTADDAAVYQLTPDLALIATTDFFMPIVDDPFDFGRIAATNAISDIYAMGGKPIMALAIVGMPISVLSKETIGAILAGGQSVCKEAGIPIAGGHTIDSVEPIYGLVALGLAHPDHIRRNAAGRAGDDLILSKPLGVGVLSAALKKGVLDDAGYQTMIGLTTKLNKPGAVLAQRVGVHAMTDVTGFGLAGHLLEVARGSGLTARLHWSAVPRVAGVEQLIEQGCLTGASERNWAAYGQEVSLAADLPATAKSLLTDPQTSGGLLISCAKDQTNGLLRLLKSEGFDQAAVIGELVKPVPQATNTAKLSVES
jgi:selenide,water dikinase